MPHEHLPTSIIQSSLGCPLQMGMLEESLVWSMLPQPAPTGSSIGQQAPSRSSGPTGSTTEQWSEIFPAQPDGAAGLKERGWAAHLRSAAWAARDTKSAAAARGGAVRQLFSNGRRHLCATQASTGMPSSSSHRACSGHLSAAQVLVCGVTCTAPAWHPHCPLLAP